MTVLITGARGQLGRELVEVFSDRSVVAFGRDELDVTSEASVFDAVVSIRPSLVVNAAALTDVDACEGDPQRAHEVNALGAWWLARAAKHVGATLVTVSTDYVFDGVTTPGPSGRPRGYNEFDPVRPINAYGRSKAASEQLVRETLHEHHIVRTSWLTGVRSRNFVTSILERALAGESLRVVDDQTSCPTSVVDLALAIREVASRGRYGTVHRTGRGCCTRYELACAVIEFAGLDVAVEPISSRTFGAVAPRPAWSVLDGTHARSLGLMELADWREAIAKLVAQLVADGGA